MAAADSVALRVELLFEEKQAMLARVAEGLSMKELDKTRCSAVIDDYESRFRGASALSVFDSTGSLVCSTHRNADVAQDLKPDGAPWFAEGIRANAFYASDAVLNPVNGRWSSVLMYPVRDASGAGAGLVTLWLDLMSLNEQMVAAVPANMLAKVIDKRNRFLLRSADQEQWLGKSIPVAAEEVIREQRQGLMTDSEAGRGVDGVDRIVVFKSLNDFGWKVAVGVPQADALAHYRELRAISVVLVFSVFASVLVLAWRMAATINKPLRALGRIVADVAAGNMAARVKIDGPAEIAAVAQQFNTMLAGREAVENSLRESEARWKFALEGAGDGVWNWDVESGRTLHSPRWREILGYGDDDEELTLADWQVRIHPDDLAKVKTDLQAHFDGESVSYVSEHRKRCKDGSYKWVLNRGMVVQRDATGRPQRMLGTVTDISARRQAEVALRESEARLSGIIDSAMDAIVSVDENRRVVVFNAAAEKMFGYSASEMMGQTLERLIPVRSREAHDKHLEKLATVEVLSRTNESQRQLTALRASGEEFPIEASSISKINIGDQKLFTVIVRDVTVRLLAEKRLQLAANVFKHAREGILITDAQGTILEVNDTFTQVTGYSREEALGNNPRMLQSGRHGREFYAAMWRDLVTQGFWSGEVWNRHKNGDVYVLMESISAVLDGDGVLQNYVTLFTDITPMKAHAQQLEHVAHYDALTNLPNRILLTERLSQAMAQSRSRGQSLAVACLDLDGFKEVNDKHGRSIGDAMLIDLTQRMKSLLRDGDTLARTGGDEFVAVLTGLRQWSDCDLVLNRLLDALSEPLKVDGISLQISASIGVTLYPQDQVDADLLIRHADQAMYVAKQAGKNCFQVFDVHQDVEVQSRRDEIEQIRQALGRREFVLYYQPKVNMSSGAVIGAEALIRWQHPKRGLLAPAEFLSFIENHPVSVEVGEWVIDTALTQMSRWQADGLNLEVSVNIGALQLQRSDFSSRLALILDRHPDVLPAHLELEILETSGLDDIAQISARIRDCQSLGVRFALDDFGTGYSSLTYLRRLPVDTLKIDRSFVRDMLDDPDDLSIVESVIGLAAAFKREVIAEGVETLGHGEQLLTMGCKLAQGYGIARPMPACDLPDWAAQWQPDPAWSGHAEPDMSRLALRAS